MISVLGTLDKNDEKTGYISVSAINTDKLENSEGRLQITFFYVLFCHREITESWNPLCTATYNPDF